MTRLEATVPATLTPVEHALVRLAAFVAIGLEPDVRAALGEALRHTTPPEWVEEVLLQSYMFAGFPRALNAMREWRRMSGQPAPSNDVDAATVEFGARGEATCEAVYGHFYERLRGNIAALHPALDRWMIETGYGQVLGRPSLDLGRRELCIVAVCAAAGQDRQLQSHLHGALHVGVESDTIASALEAVADLTPDGGERARRLWAHVQQSHDRHLQAPDSH